MSRGRKIISVKAVDLAEILLGKARLPSLPEDFEIEGIQFDFIRSEPQYCIRGSSASWQDTPPYSPLQMEGRKVEKT